MVFGTHGYEVLLSQDYLHDGASVDVVGLKDLRGSSNVLRVTDHHPDRPSSGTVRHLHPVLCVPRDCVCVCVYVCV